MLARGRGVPMVVGVPRFEEHLNGALAEAIVDGAEGLIMIGPSASDLDAFGALRIAAAASAARAEAYLAKPAVTADGTPVAVHVNVADPAELDALDPASCDGIGLVGQSCCSAAALFPTKSASSRSIGVSPNGRPAGPSPSAPLTWAATSRSRG